LLNQLPAILENAENVLTGCSRAILFALRDEWEKLQQNIEAISKEFD